MYTIGLASITIQTNSANREKEAATVEVTKVHGAGGQHCTLTPQGPGGRFWPFQRLPGLRGPRQHALLHQKCHRVGWVKQASVHPSQEPLVNQGHEQITPQSAKAPRSGGTLAP